MSSGSACVLVLVSCFSLAAQPFNTNLYRAMRWRQIGPFRAGRVTAATGIPGNAAIYYMGTPGGKVGAVPPAPLPVPSCK